MERPPPSALLGCVAILVDFVGLGMIAPILPGIVSRDAIGNILSAQCTIAAKFGTLTRQRHLH